MIIEESFIVPASPDQVAAFLLDVEQVSKCVPGVEDVRDSGNGQYEATLKVQLGPLRSQFAGHVQVDPEGAPARLAAVGRGRDRSTGSQAQVQFSAELSEQADATTLVACIADVTIRGRLGQFGTGVITSTARSLIREFAACVARTVGQPQPAVGHRTGGSSDAARVGRIARRGMVLYLVALLSRVRAWLRRPRPDRADRP